MERSSHTFSCILFPLAACQKQSQFDITASPSEVIKKLILLRKHNYPAAHRTYLLVKAVVPHSQRQTQIVSLAIPSPLFGASYPITTHYNASVTGNQASSAPLKHEEAMELKMVKDIRHRSVKFLVIRIRDMSQQPRRLP